jgi:hypothetical protein
MAVLLIAVVAVVGAWRRGRGGALPVAAARSDVRIDVNVVDGDDVEVSFAAQAVASGALVVADADGTILAPPAWFERRAGDATRLRTRVPLRGLATHTNALVGLAIFGARGDVRAGLDALAPGDAGAPAVRSLDALEAALCAHGARAQRVDLAAGRAAVAFDPRVLDEAERLTITGDPARALDMVERMRAAVPAADAARADAIAAEAAFAFGRIRLARVIAERGLRGEKLDVGLEARLLRVEAIAHAEGDEATTPPPGRARLRATEGQRSDPLEAVLDAALDLRFAELHDRFTDEPPRAPDAALELLGRVDAAEPSRLGSAAVMICRAGAFRSKRLAPERAIRALDLGIDLARREGRVADEANCAISRGDYERRASHFDDAARFYGRALAILGERPLPREQREAWFSAALLADARKDHRTAYADAKMACRWVDYLLDLETDLAAREALLIDAHGYYGNAARFGIEAGEPGRGIALSEWGKARAYRAVLRGEGTIDESAMGSWIASADDAGAPDDRPLAELSDSLAPEDAALAYTFLAVGNNGRFGIAIGVVTHGEVTGFIVDRPPTYRSDFAALVEAVQNNDEAAARGPGKRLYDALIAPIEGVLAGRTRLFVSPQFRLHSLPWGALYDGKQFLAERFAFARVPPLHFAKRDRDDDAVKLNAPRRWLIAANPTHPASEPLPGLEALAERMQERLGGATMLRGSEVTASRLVDGIAGVQGVLYAGHARYDASRPLRSALLVASSPAEEDRVEAARILSLGHRLDVVILLGCETARMWKGKPSYGDEAIGLARAFLAGGARHVVGALWPVIDRDAEDFLSALLSQSPDLDVVRAVGATQACLATGRCKGRGIATWGSYLVDAR